MDNSLEQGHGPFTAYVDHSFHPASASSPSKPPSPSKSKVPGVRNPDASDVDQVLRTKDPKKIKALVREGHWGVTDDVRRVMWWKVSCAVHKDAASASIYDEMVKEVFGEGASLHDVTMPAFVDMSTKEHYHLSEPGIHVAKKVICILGNTCPDITYAPLVFSMACLLLHYMDEGDCYNCLYGLLRSHDDFLSQTKNAHEVMKFVLRDLCRKYCKGLSSYISKRGLQMEGVLDNWIWWIFRDLPFSHLVRIVDCYLVEGVKILYRTALAILTLFFKLVVKPHKVEEDLNRALSQFCEDIPVTPDRLLKVAFGIRGLSRKEIRKYKVKSEMYVKSLRHAPLPQTIPKSDSCESLNLKVSRSFSGPMNLQSVDSKILKMDQISTNQPMGRQNLSRRTRSNSHGLAVITKRCQSGLLTQSDWQTIWQWLPTRITLNQPVLLYTSAEHGTSLMTFYARIEGTEPTLLVIKTSKNEVIGAYCSDDWANRIGKQRQYFGTGESFIFTLSPRRHHYSWVGIELKEQTPATASLFMRGDSQSLNIGGGGSGVALSLDENLYEGRSQKCSTYNNDPLVDGEDFQCLTVEVFGFGQPE